MIGTGSFKTCAFSLLCGRGMDKKEQREEPSKGYALCQRLSECTVRLSSLALDSGNRGIESSLLYLVELDESMWVT